MEALCTGPDENVVLCFEAETRKAFAASCSAGEARLVREMSLGLEAIPVKLSGSKALME